MSTNPIASAIDSRGLSSLAKGLKRELLPTTGEFTPSHEQLRQLIARALGFKDAGGLLAHSEVQARALPRHSDSSVSLADTMTSLTVAIDVVRALASEAQSASQALKPNDAVILAAAAETALARISACEGVLQRPDNASPSPPQEEVATASQSYFLDAVSDLNRAHRQLADAWGDDNTIDPSLFKRGLRLLADANMRSNRRRDLLAQTMQGIHPMLDCCTAHVTKEDAALLDGWSLRVPSRSDEQYREVRNTNPDPIPVVATDFGWLVTVPHDDTREHDASMRKAGLSSAFLGLIRYARQRGAWKIYLHADAEVIDVLPTFEW